MTIDARIPTTTIALRLEDREIELHIYTASSSTLRSIWNTYDQLTELDKKRTVLDDNLSKLETARYLCELVTKETELLIEALKSVLGKEWAKIEDVADYLPTSTLSRLLSAIAESIGNAILTDYAEGKI